LSIANLQGSLLREVCALFTSGDLEAFKSRRLVKKAAMLAGGAFLFRGRRNRGDPRRPGIRVDACSTLHGCRTGAPRAASNSRVTHSGRISSYIAPTRLWWVATEMTKIADRISVESIGRIAATMAGVQGISWEHAKEFGFPISLYTRPHRPAKVAAMESNRSSWLRIFLALH
jgi:hypothetical protein